MQQHLNVTEPFSNNFFEVCSYNDGPLATVSFLTTILSVFIEVFRKKFQEQNNFKFSKSNFDFF